MLEGNRAISYTFIDDLARVMMQSIDIESSFQRMTPDKAAGSSFQFGVAIRYRVASDPDEKTLHDMRAFNVGCVIENQLDPGSCVPADTANHSADAGASAR